MADTLGRFVWHEVMTDDSKAAEEFYKRVVGWDTEPYPNSPTPYTLLKGGDSPSAGLMPIPEDAKKMGAGPSWIPYVSTPDVDKTVEEARTLGGKVHKGPFDVPEIGRIAILQDPQGASFAVWKPERDMEPETDPQPLQFSWHELATSDPAGAWDFYSKLFDWKKTSAMDMGPAGTYQMFGRDRFEYGGVYQKPAEMQAPPNWLSYVRVDSADDAAERATKAGGTVINGPMDVPGGDRIAVIMDPQGAAFAVHSKAK